MQGINYKFFWELTKKFTWKCFISKPLALFGTAVKICHQRYYIYDFSFKQEETVFTGRPPVFIRQWKQEMQILPFKKWKENVQRYITLNCSHTGFLPLKITINVYPSKRTINNHQILFVSCYIVQHRKPWANFWGYYSCPFSQPNRITEDDEF